MVLALVEHICSGDAIDMQATLESRPWWLREPHSGARSGFWGREFLGNNEFAGNKAFA